MLVAPANPWDYPASYRCITTNGVMGAGVALEAKERFPHLPDKPDCGNGGLNWR